MSDKLVFIRDTNPQKPNKTREFYNLFVDQINKNNLSDKVKVIRSADIGIYNKGISIKILPDNIIYTNIQESDLPRIVDNTIKRDNILVDLVLKEKIKQLRIALRNCGIIDPENIDEYIANDGYFALKKVLIDNNPNNIIEELKISNLRGRGGGGYPTWLKWQFTKNVVAKEKYIICNADEGDPGAYMDRSMLEGDPHSVIEGMIIAGIAVGAQEGFFYIRAEYPLAIQRVQNAIDQAYEYGILGNNVLGSQYSFDIEIRLGAGAFVCGEETALIASIEGRRGYPRSRPPYPSVKGLWSHPTIINNVETLSNVPYIILEGGKAYSGIGVGQSTGTKVFALTGKIKNSGLVEVPMGTTLNDIVYEIGGGTFSGKKVKAIQTGGPSGGVIPFDYFNSPVSYEHLHDLGSIMGSGGMIVMDEDDCMVDISKFYLGFCVDESCGKCSPCRIGGYQMLSILERISNGEGNLKDIEHLKAISSGMQKASLCGLGQSAPNPVISTLKYYYEEYKEHIINKKCPANKCLSLLFYTIDQTICDKCGNCITNCKGDAIQGNYESGYTINNIKCERCGNCMEVCSKDAIVKAW